MQQHVDCKWTNMDTVICERAESSGLAININTGNALTLQELKSLAQKYDSIRSSTTVDAFLKDKVNSKPFEF